MSDTTDIEKKSLEAHVELCAARYRFLEEKLEVVDRKLEDLAGAVSEIRNIVQTSAEKRNDQVLAWSVGTITVMIGVIGYLLAVFVIK
jgi:hypothetical protein